MLLVGVIFLISSTSSMGESVSCPYYSLVSDNWRKRLLENTNKLRRDLATGEYSLPAAKQMNELAWNCETEYNLKKIQEQILETNSTIRYRNFGVNTLEEMFSACDLQTMGYLPSQWTMDEDSLPPSLIYDGTASTLHVSNRQQNIFPHWKDIKEWLRTLCRLHSSVLGYSLVLMVRLLWRLSIHVEQFILKSIIVFLAFLAPTCFRGIYRTPCIITRGALKCKRRRNAKLQQKFYYICDEKIFKRKVCNLLYKWNATELACTYGTYANEKLVLLICAYNVKGAVVGETIYEKSQDGKYVCDDGAKCGTDGTCNEKLCRVPILNPDSLLHIYSPSLFCPSLSFMNQFSRYYALNMHNSYRRLVATGWAENKLTSYAPTAARMEILSYDCRLEEAASETVKKCEKQPASENSEDAGSNVEIIEDANISKEAAIETAISTWFSQLQKYGVDPNSTWTENPTVMNCANVMHDKYETVGCAVNNCPTKGFTIVECRYGPKGLQHGSLIYDVGSPCSRCTQDQKCVYGALCQ